MCRATISTAFLRAHYTIRGAPSKPSKSALKKAAKAARQEKKQQSRASGGDTSKPGQSPSSPTLPLAQPTAPEAGLVAASDQHSVGPSPPIEFPKPSPPMANTISAPNEVPRSALNGHHIGPKGGPQRPNQESSVSSSVGRPTTKDQPFPPVQTSSSPSKPVPQPSESNSRPRSTNKEPAPSSSKPVANLEADKAAKKGHNVLVRTLWTFIMIGGFMGQFDNK